MFWKNSKLAYYLILSANETYLPTLVQPQNPQNISVGNLPKLIKGLNYSGKQNRDTNIFLSRSAFLILSFVNFHCSIP